MRGPKFAKQPKLCSCAFGFASTLSRAMLRNMLDGDGQDQYDSGGWCFPKPIPPQNKNDGQTRVLDPMMPVNTNEAFVAGLREYPDEDPRLWQAHKKEWQSVQGGSILTICKLHPSQRPPMVRPEDDNEVCAAAALPSAAHHHGHAHACMQRPVPPTWLILARSLPVRLACARSLGSRTSTSSSRSLSRRGSRSSRQVGWAKTLSLRWARRAFWARRRASSRTTSTASAVSPGSPSELAATTAGGAGGAGAQRVPYVARAKSTIGVEGSVATAHCRLWPRARLADVHGMGRTDDE